MTSSVSREKCHTATLKLTKNKRVRWIAERRGHALFAHISKSRHGVQATASDDANLCLLQTPCSSLTNAARTYRDPLEVYRCSAPALTAPKEARTRAIERAGSRCSTAACFIGPSACTLAIVFRSLRASATSKPSLTNTPVPESEIKTSPSLVENTCSFSSASSFVRSTTPEYFLGICAPYVCIKERAESRFFQRE